MSEPNYVTQWSSQVVQVHYVPLTIIPGHQNSLAKTTYIDIYNDIDDFLTILSTILHDYKQVLHTVLPVFTTTYCACVILL